MIFPGHIRLFLPMLRLPVPGFILEGGELGYSLATAYSCDGQSRFDCSRSGG